MGASMTNNESALQRGIGERVIDTELSAGNLSRTVSLVSSNLTIFTFVLVFLFPRYKAQEMNGLLFQVTLTVSLLTVFLIVVSGVSYFEAIALSKASVERRKALIRRGDSLFVVGLSISTAMPALILFTLPGLSAVAVVAAILWTLSASFILRQGQKLLHGWSR